MRSNVDANPLRCRISVAMTAASSSDQPNSLAILIVDDEPNIRRVLSAGLESHGHKVVAVGNSRDALAEANQRSFDLAFVDLRLGTEDGIDDQNIVLLFLEALGTGCSTSQCSTILPSTSKRKMSTPAISWPNKFR